MSELEDDLALKYVQVQYTVTVQFLVSSSLFFIYISPADCLVILD